MPGIHWEGAVNARLLAGDIYRMGRSEWLTERGWQQVRDDGVRTVIDLRNPGERLRRPTDPVVGEAAMAGFDVVNLPTEDPDNAEYQALCQPYLNHPNHYADILRLFPEKIVAVIKELAVARGAAVIHCSAGRDRTGLIASLLLALLDETDRVRQEDELATRGINEWHLVAPVKHPYERYLDAAAMAEVVADRGRAVAGFIGGLDVRTFLLANGVSAAEIAAVVARLR
ncbi:protein tyrosine phosphatase [Arthrobacter alpinus]|uniref:Protein tyrosine phosphatase n=1 Tax=Arthrobacter alpinus TaxID=656366 RepID=A0A0M4RQ71_9MICC|nr:tyrosine-protein phosphatase [Arthrobacter alpinus]ALE93146.1 protein tyrosine phosphatase [Arthrobacter alpinus]